MVSANRLINIGAIPLVIVTYAVFLCIDHNRCARTASLMCAMALIDTDITQHILQNGDVDGIVFGGSNAFYSLSAESLSYFTRMKWFNAAMDSEEITGPRIIRDLSTRINRTKVKYVVYSSIFPYTHGRLTSDTLDQKVIGEGIKPGRSFFNTIKNGSNIAHLRNSEIRNARDGFGDIVFNKIECDFTTDNRIFTRSKIAVAPDPEGLHLIHEREEIGITVESLVDKAIYLASNFPNALILIVLPSYYRGPVFDDSMFDQALRTKFYSTLSGRHSQNSMMKIIVQPPYVSVTQLCDSPWHANEDGRVWRTQNLIELMAMPAGHTLVADDAREFSH
jgi:hypothetical protein